MAATILTEWNSVKCGAQPTNQKADCEMATAPRQRKIFLNEGRVFIQCPGLMTDSELADVLPQYISTVRAKSLQSKASADVPTPPSEPGKDRRKC
jgi:hypothetical protein